MIAVLHFSTAAGDGVIGVSCLDLQMSSNECAVLVSSPSFVRRKVDELVILEVIQDVALIPLLW